MAEQDADLLKVLVGQVTKDRDIDSVFGKTLRVGARRGMTAPWWSRTA
jgi:hypothetical protein